MQYLAISRDSSVKGDDDKKKRKKKKKDKKKKGGDESSAEEEEITTQNFVISRAVDMPEGATMSDGDDDRDNLDENDPHRALGDIIFDDYKLEPESESSNHRSSNQIEVGGIFAPVDVHKSKKKKKKEEKPEKKSKKKKEKRDKENAHSASVEVQETPKKEEEMDINFWLGTEHSNGVSEKSEAVQEESEHKKKKEKKEKKHKKEKKEKKKSSKENGTSKESYDLIAVDSHYHPLAESRDLKMFYELRKVPLDTEKLAAAVQVKQHINLQNKHWIGLLNNVPRTRKKQNPFYESFRTLVI